MRFDTSVLLLGLWASSSEAFSVSAPSLQRRQRSPSASASATSLRSIAALSESEQEHARQVFTSLVPVDDDDDEDDYKETFLEPNQLADLLHALDIPASDEEASALFKYLDPDDSGQIDWMDFLPWYAQAAASIKEQAQAFQDILQSRRTVSHFLTTAIDAAVVERAIASAIAAPNRSGSEPWKFRTLGPTTVAKLADLKTSLATTDDDGHNSQWTQIPGWCVVTYPKQPDGNTKAQREDFKSCCCAIENFMLSLWSEGIGSKWTDGDLQSTPEFADICGIDLSEEKVAGVIWYGFASGGLGQAEPKQRRKTVQDVLVQLP